MTDPSALAIARELIVCPSVTPAEAGALDALQARLEAAGFACTRLPFGGGDTDRVDNLFARIGSGPPHLSFAGHTDVVPPGDEGAWTHPPFAAAVDKGCLWGRGAVDMKGGIACFAAAAFDLLRARSEPLPGSLSFLITGDEEADAVNGTVKVLEWMAANGQVPDHCIVGEPTNPAQLGDALKIGRRGSLTALFTIDGRQGHTAYPHIADNPVPKLVRLLDRLASRTLDQGTVHFEPSNLEITTIDVGNPAGNVIPGGARARINIRFNDAHSGAELKAWIAREAAEVEATMGGTVQIDYAPQSDCFITEPGRLTDLMADAVHAVTGRTPELSTSGGTSDARFIKDYCPVIEFGLVNATIHQVDEHVPLADLEQLTAIYRRFLETYFG